MPLLQASRLFGTSSGGVENVVLGMGGQSGRGRGERGCGRRPAGLVEDWDGSVAGDEGKGGTEHEMMERQDKGGERKGRGPGQDIGKGKREWASQARMGKSEGRSPTEGKGRVKRGAGQAQDPDACDSHVEEGKEEVELLYELD